MTPDTLGLDRIFPGVGRLKRASGTTDPKMRKRIDGMLTDLFEDGRLDVLRAIKAGELHPMEVYAHWKAKSVDQLALGAALKPLHEAFEAWRVRATRNVWTLQSRAQSGRYLAQYGTRASRIADVPRILLKARGEMDAAGHAVSFNRLKSAAQAFVRDTLGKASPLYREVTGVPTIEHETRVVRRPMTPGHLWRWLGSDACTDDATAYAAWTMATTGMGPGEYWGRWERHVGYVQIIGTKRKGRVRKVPDLGQLGHYGPPPLSRQSFEDRLVKMAAPFKPYDLRRSYANWMDSAGIPRIRRMMYLGHGARDVTDLYEQHDVLRFLAEDASKLAAYITTARESIRPKLVAEDTK